MVFPERLVTSRLTLRLFDATDVERLTDIYADEATMRFVGGVRTRRQVCDELAEVVAGYELHGLGPRAIVLGDQLIGRCGLDLRHVDGQTQLELNYLLASEAQGRGYATEAATAVRDAAFDAGRTRLIALIADGNLASVRVAERLGMRRRGDTHWQGARAGVYAVDADQLAGL